MRSSAPIGRIAGVKVSVDASVLVIALLLAWTLATSYLPSVAPHASTVIDWCAGAVGALLLLGSLLAHEVAHAVVARRAGVEVEGLTLWMLGGVARLGGDPPDARAEFRIAAIGPAVSLALGVGFAAVAGLLASAGVSKVVTGIAWWLSVINVVLAVFNLLPGSPLDGGRLLTAVIWRRTGDRVRATMQAARAGQTVGFVLIALGLVSLLTGDSVGGVWTVLVGGFLAVTAWTEYTASAAVRLLDGLRAQDLMSTPVETGRADLTVEEFVNAHLLHGGHYSSYPLVDADHAVQGLVGLPQIRALPRERWATTTVGQIAIPLERLCIRRPIDPATSVQGSVETGGRALIVDQGDLVGIVSPSDIARTLRSRATAAV